MTTPTGSDTDKARQLSRERIVAHYRRGVETAANAPAVWMSIPTWAAAFRHLWSARQRDLRALHRRDSS